MTDTPKQENAKKFLDNLAAFLADDDRHGKELIYDLRARGLDPETLLADLRAILRTGCSIPESDGPKQETCPTCGSDDGKWNTFCRDSWHSIPVEAPPTHSLHDCEFCEEIERLNVLPEKGKKTTC